MLSPALPAISDHFPGATEANIGLVLTVQTVAIAISLPLVGIVADNVGARRILQISLGLYTLFGAGCVLAPSYTALLALRALQGVAYSGIIPIVTSVCPGRSKATRKPRCRACSRRRPASPGFSTPSSAVYSSRCRSGRRFCSTGVCSRSGFLHIDTSQTSQRHRARKPSGSEASLDISNIPM